MQQEEAAGFVPAEGNLWLAAPEQTQAQFALLHLTFVSSFFFLASFLLSGCRAEIRFDLIFFI